ncbi:MAG: hypothetical protein KC964_28810 [Candidatus Omnitrophica bacterium]|nr:hypothetical protein [Candidatus Omnitrophota bacterium]
MRDMVLPIIVLVALLMGGCQRQPTAEEKACFYAWEKVKFTLRAPHTARLERCEIYRVDSNYYYVDIDYIAQNGFGGWNRGEELSVEIKKSLVEGGNP